MCTCKGYAASVSQLTLATAALYFPLLILHSWGKRFAAQPQTIYSEIPQIFSLSISYSLINSKPQMGQRHFFTCDGPQNMV